MTKRRGALYRMLTVLVALYGVMSACVCNDHAPVQAAMPACHHCPPSAHNIDATLPQMASHHECCGMERAPIAVERVASVSPIVSDHYIVLPVAILVSEPDVASVVVSSLSHAPPEDIPLYLTTQRFVI